MESHTGSFTAAGQKSPVLTVLPGRSLAYALTGTYVATLLLVELRPDGGTARTLATISGDVDTTFVNQTGQPIRAQLVCKSQASGSADWTFAEVNDSQEFGLDLSTITATMTKGAARLTDDICILVTAGAPVDYTDGTPPATGEGFAAKGSLCIDKTNGALYINGGTKAQPVWAKMARFSDI